MQQHNFTSTGLRQLDSLHHLHPFTDHAELSKVGVRVIERAKGHILYDIDGNEILDAMAGLWCVNVGYGREDLAKVAYQQMKELPYYNTFFKTTTIPSTILAQRLIEASPFESGKVFFGSSGSESNDTLIRTIRYYWRLCEMPKKQIIISRHKAYHGSTIASASMGGTQAMHEQIGGGANGGGGNNSGGGLLSGFHHIAPPYSFELQNENESLDEFTNRSANELQKAIDELGAENIAAFVGEPIQGAGGVIIPPPNYWQIIKEICKKNNILLAFDEVITGFGRLGEWFGGQFFNVCPDLMTVAKGITSGYQPLSAILLNKNISDVLERGGEYYHGYTYSGHPVACAVATANMDILQNEGLIGRVKNETANYLLQALQENFGGHELVGEVRGQGLLAAIEIVGNKQTGERFANEKRAGNVVRDCCIEAGIMARAVGDTIILSPSLTWEKSTIDRAVDLLNVGFNKAIGEI